MYGLSWLEALAAYDVAWVRDTATPALETSRLHNSTRSPTRPFVHNRQRRQQILVGNRRTQRSVHDMGPEWWYHRDNPGARSRQTFHLSVDQPRVPEDTSQHAICSEGEQLQSYAEHHDKPLRIPSVSVRSCDC